MITSCQAASGQKIADSTTKLTDIVARTQPQTISSNKETSLPPPTTQKTVTSTTTPHATSTTVTTPTTSTTIATAAEFSLAEDLTVSDAQLQPKSITATGTGLFFSQNMMYRHNITVVDIDGSIIKVIDDTVDLPTFGIDGPTVQGSPVEAVVTPDQQFVYVSNYKMFGPGYNSNADDNCDSGTWENSFVYRIKTETLEIDGVIEVGAVPKFMDITPDGTQLLVANWCSFDISVIDLDKQVEIARIPTGPHPRGIAITSDSRTAYVAVMGNSTILEINLNNLSITGTLPDSGITPRHLIISADDRYLYVTNNHGDTVRKLDLQNIDPPIIQSVPASPRTMAISGDGTALYVVSYDADALTILATDTLQMLQQLRTGRRPIGVTFDNESQTVWVANYTGTITKYASTIDAP